MPEVFGDEALATIWAAPKRLGLRGGWHEVRMVNRE
jgi:hypothetical protein